MDSCIICYEDKNLILPPNCKCKLVLHKICLEKMIQSLNIDCPMCRNKIKNIKMIIYNDDRIHPLLNISKIIITLLIFFNLIIFFSIFFIIKFLVNIGFWLFNFIKYLFS